MAGRGMKKVRRIERPHVLSIRLSDVELRDLNAAIDEQGASASDLVRYAIAHYLYQERKRREAA